jgi:hypothetical protein
LIAGRFDPAPGGPVPVITGELSIPSLDARGNLPFLIDTGAGATVLTPAGSRVLRIDPAALSADRAMRGVGGSVPAVVLPAVLAFGALTLELRLRILAPRSDSERNATLRLPNVLGRDVLAHFALFIEARTRRVLLLDAAEADRVRYS